MTIRPPTPGTSLSSGANVRIARAQGAADEYSPGGNASVVGGVDDAWAISDTVVAIRGNDVIRVQLYGGKSEDAQVGPLAADALPAQ